MKNNAYKTTKRQFRFFKAKCQEYIKELGLLSWRIFFEHDELEDCFAEIKMAPENRVAEITLSKTWIRKPTKEQLSRTAFHEVCELLLCPLENPNDQDNLREEIHAVIRILENTLWSRLARKD